MSVIVSEVRHGAYYDSIVLMQLQSALVDLPGVTDAGVVLATQANLALLRSSDLLPPGPTSAGPEDLLVVVKAGSEEAAHRALGEVEGLLSRRRGAGGEEYTPRSLEGAVRQWPQAGWVTVSVPGRYASGLARRALDLDRCVFLYSDNVSLADEVSLKEEARRKGLLVLGPDCGTAFVGGVGLGFANRVRRGSVGLVGASGTGLQTVATHLHNLGAGISHALGTGGRDLSSQVKAATTLQALDLLGRDPDTGTVVLISKPPSPTVAGRVVAAARATGKPVVVCFLGHTPPVRRLGSVTFASGLFEAAQLAASPCGVSGTGGEVEGEVPAGTGAPGRAGYLRGLFSGGTLAYEALLQLRLLVSPLYSNLRGGGDAGDQPLAGVEALPDLSRSLGHTILDMGADELTVGRPHPMIDGDLRLRRLRREAEDPDVGTLLLDVVLGDGVHPDPAAELAPVIREIKGGRPELELVTVVVGSDEDPQGLETQLDQLREAGAQTFDDVGRAISFVCQRGSVGPAAETGAEPKVALRHLQAPPAVVNVGLEHFYHSLRSQGAWAVHVDWRPPAAGNERLQAILAKMRGP